MYLCNMGIIIRQGIKSSVVSYIGVVIGTINVLYLYNKFLSPAQLGLYLALTSFPLVFSGIAHLGTPLVGVRFFNQFADTEKQHNGLLGYLLIVPFVGFLLFCLLFYGNQDLLKSLYIGNSPLLVQYFWTFPLLTFLLMYCSVFENYSRSHLRIVVPTISREIVLKLGNSVLAVGFGTGFLSFDQLVLGIIGILAVALLVNILYIKWLGRLYLQFSLKAFTKTKLKEMWAYGLWTLLGGLAGIILPHIEKLMLPAFAGGLDAAAIFSIASSIALVIVIPRNTVASVSEPLLAESFQTNDHENIKNIYQKSAITLGIVGCFLFLGIWCNIDDIFGLIPNESIYRQGRYVVLFVGLYAVIDMATGLNSELLKNSKYYKIDFGFYVIRCVALIATNLLLIPKYGYNGAAMAMLLSTIVYNFVKYVFIYNKLGLSPFTTNTLKLILLFVGCWALVYGIDQILLAEIHLLIRIAIRSIIILTVFGGGVYGFKLSSDINNVIHFIFKKAKLRD
jgi:O-antigen/teichoic acid export membrane protein